MQRLKIYSVHFLLSSYHSFSHYIFLNVNFIALSRLFKYFSFSFRFFSFHKNCFKNREHSLNSFESRLSSISRYWKFIGKTGFCLGFQTTQNMIAIETKQQMQIIPRVIREEIKINLSCCAIARWNAETERFIAPTACRLQSPLDLIWLKFQRLFPVTTRINWCHYELSLSIVINQWAFNEFSIKTFSQNDAQLDTSTSGRLSVMHFSCKIKLLSGN